MKIRYFYFTIFALFLLGGGTGNAKKTETVPAPVAQPIEQSEQPINQPKRQPIKQAVAQAAAKSVPKEESQSLFRDCPKEYEDIREVYDYPQDLRVCYSKKDKVDLHFKADSLLPSVTAKIPLSGAMVYKAGYSGDRRLFTVSFFDLDTQENTIYVVYNDAASVSTCYKYGSNGIDTSYSYSLDGSLSVQKNEVNFDFYLSGALKSYMIYENGAYHIDYNYREDGTLSWYTKYLLPPVVSQSAGDKMPGKKRMRIPEVRIYFDEQGKVKRFSSYDKSLTEKDILKKFDPAAVPDAKKFKAADYSVYKILPKQFNLKKEL